MHTTNIAEDDPYCCLYSEQHLLHLLLFTWLTCIILRNNNTS